MSLRRTVLHLSGMRAFEAAARHGSFARAAAELNVTPAAVSQHVRGLEAYLGFRLFRRSAGGLAPTDEALSVLPDVRDGFERLAAAQQRLRSQGAHGTLTVTTSPSFAAKWLMPRIEVFRAQHPDISLRLDVTERLVDFAREEVDLGVRYGRGVYRDLESELLLEEQVFPVCSPLLLDGAAPLRRPADLARHTLIHDATIAFDPGFPNWRTWLAIAGLHELKPAGELHLNSSLLATQAAVDRQGVALGRSVIVADDLRAGRLVRPFGVGGCAVRCAYHLVHRAEVATLPRLLAFKQWLMGEVSVSHAAGD